ncbi:hypothetical protein WT91_29575 [Burkholderia stagnalis]|nr:hypothetical protein [Burkholderia stagnalis]KWN83000.1 hypothetical protein WT91_29575 [Burkholderia stagnalis]
MTVRAAFAASLFAGAGHASASDFGCTVLLCLANPASNGGPKGVAECVAPITKLFDDLAHFRPFPTCDFADGNDGSSYAKQLTDAYDPCPAPLKAAVRRSWVAEGKRNGKKPQWQMGPWVAYAYNSADLYDLTVKPQQSEALLFGGSPQACVGNAVGSFTVGNSNSDFDPYTVTVYDKVMWQPYQSPRAIDIYIDNKFYQRVHW